MPVELQNLTDGITNPVRLRFALKVVGWAEAGMPRPIIWFSRCSEEFG